jgi:p-cumate 2,3-dioxygenase beta subunit
VERLDGDRGCGVIAPAAAERFLYREADLLDSWQLDEWLELFSKDARYVVPTTDLPTGDPHSDLVFIDDDKVRLTARVHRLNSRRAHREFPWSRTRHLVTNVLVVGGEGDRALVKANFVVYRIRNGVSAYIGHYDYTLLVEEDEPVQIEYKRATLDLEELRPHGTVSILL